MMTKKERQKLASAMGKASWKSRKKNKEKALEHLRKIASKGGIARQNKAKKPA